MRQIYPSILSTFMQQHRNQIINGIETDVIVQNYNDRTFVLVTQLGKVGNLIQASIPPTTGLPPPPLVPGQLPPPPAAVQLTNLLGIAPSEHVQTLHALYAAQIATLVWIYEPPSALDRGRKSVVVGLALRKSEGGELNEDEKIIFREVMEVIQGMVKQAPTM